MWGCVWLPETRKEEQGSSYRFWGAQRRNWESKISFYMSSSRYLLDIQWRSEGGIRPRVCITWFVTTQGATGAGTPGALPRRGNPEELGPRYWYHVLSWKPCVASGRECTTVSCSARSLRRVGTEILLHLATEIFGDLVTNNFAGTGGWKGFKEEQE